MNLDVFLERYGIYLLVLFATAVGAGVKLFAGTTQSHRLSPKKRVWFIALYMLGATFLFDFLLYYFLQRDIESNSPLLFLPVAAFTVWMGYAMLELIFRVKREDAGRTADGRSFAGRFAIGMVVFGALTIASIAYVLFYL